MNSLQWAELADKFGQFAALARKYGFYLAELDNMERSLAEMHPYKNLLTKRRKEGTK